MRIGEVAAESGVTVKAIRHYEAEGLLGRVQRRGSYRSYDDGHLRRLRLIAHCRAQGFSVPEVREILALLPTSGCPDPRAMETLVATKLEDVRREQTRLRATARRLERTRAYLRQRAAEHPSAIGA